MAVALVPSANAAGLGRLTVLSHLGDNLRAQIELTSVGKDEAGSLVAHLASADEFAHANLDYNADLAALQFAIVQRPDGTQYLSITSQRAINDPFLDVLVELDWNSGRLVREYTVLLDPPGFKAAEGAPISPVSPVVSSSLRGRSSAAAAHATPREIHATPAQSQGAAGTAPAHSYEVKRGDTLERIARQNEPSGTSLEQTLVALLRTNPDAFAGNNINRLRSGATLRIPDASSVRSVDGEDAQRMVKAQSADFNAYRSRIASAVAQAAPGASSQGKQSASGKLSAKIEDTLGRAQQSTDQLKLSKPSDKTGAGKAGSGPTAEDLAVQQQAVKEANERVKLLEKNVTDLQNLLALKNQELANVQKQATQAAEAKASAAKVVAATPPPAVSAPIAAAAKPTSAPSTASPLQVEPASKTPASPTETATHAAATTSTAAPEPSKPAAAAGPVTKRPIAVAPTPATSESSTFIDDILGNPTAVGLLALVVLLVLGYAFYSMRRKKKFSKFEDSILTGSSGLHANSVFGTTGGQSVDTTNSSFNSNFVPMSGQADTNEVDPVAEADVYIAYGRDAQAEEILKEALRTQPDRHAVRLKLLEIYAKRQDAKQFETVASELYAQTAGVGDEWHRAAVMGASFDPANPLYRDADSPAVAAPSAPAPAHMTPSTTPSAFEKTQSLAASDLAAAGIGHLRSMPPPVEYGGTGFTNTQPLEPILDLDLTKTEPLQSGHGGGAEASNSAMDLDFDLGFGAEPEAPAVPPHAASDPAAEAASNRLAASNKHMDFDLDLSGPSSDTPRVFAPHEQPIDFSASEFAPREAPEDRPVSAFGAPTGVTPAAESMPAEPHFEVPHHTSSEEHIDTPVAVHDRIPTLEGAFGGLTLDLEKGTVNGGSHEDLSGNGKWQDMATKLDLAVAYRDIGDKDGARELLEEVLKEGDAAQIDRARELMSALA